jgi:SNF2 family DNA or RNA helicase
VLSKLRKICDGGKEFEENAKTLATGELIRKIHENNEKVIVFSYYLDPLYGLEELLKTINIPYVKFFDVDVDAREESVDTFRSDATVTVFIASSRIASEGLTLTEANNVIFLNRWWNPSSNSQARDRVVRIGQEKPVTIYNLFCADTVEERVTQILRDKNDIYSKVTDGLVDDLSSLTKEIINEPKN